MQEQQSSGKRQDWSNFGAVPFSCQKGAKWQNGKMVPEWPMARSLPLHLAFSRTA